MNPPSCIFCHYELTMAINPMNVGGWLWNCNSCYQENNVQTIYSYSKANQSFTTLFFIWEYRNSIYRVNICPYLNMMNIFICERYFSKKLSVSNISDMIDFAFAQILEDRVISGKLHWVFPYNIRQKISSYLVFL